MPPQRIIFQVLCDVGNFEAELPLKAKDACRCAVPRHSSGFRPQKGATLHHVEASLLCCELGNSRWFLQVFRKPRFDGLKVCRTCCRGLSLEPVSTSLR